MSQSSTDVHQTCQQDLVYVRSVHFRQTDSEINCYYCSYGSILTLMSNISKKVSATMLD